MRNKLIYFILLAIGFTSIIQSCQNETSINFKRYYVNGKGIYEKNCQNCHGSDGKGLGTLYPPLTDSTYLKLNKNSLACIIRNGQTGTVKINNISYEGIMPGNETLADIDIAQVVVYITNSFGNKQGFYDSETAKKDLEKCN
ncbi:nitrite reductase (NO-forming) [Daejeonella rubra]|uniref:Nitrite reductase (NO-forming) n=1 Tax=Daejeonella rubra TaxID=990371 RepID=A0A1G9M0A1_9SPHI|nr:cytochrome c [Daejeonella rubra]SDL67574.1 nitrite reductase (NO-forming) [Daejeonella rubra]